MICFLHLLVHCREESVIVQGLFFNTSKRKVKQMSFKEASSSSWAEVVSSLPSELVLGCLLSIYVLSIIIMVTCTSVLCLLATPLVVM